MASARRTSPTVLLTLVALGALCGSLAWELLERLLRVPYSLATQPIQLFDLYVVALIVRANPGSLLGGVAGLLIARSL